MIDNISKEIIGPWTHMEGGRVLNDHVWMCHIDIFTQDLSEHSVPIHADGRSVRWDEYKGQI